MAVSALYLLGSPRMERGGAPLEVDTRKAPALVAYLAVTTRQPQTRDALAGLLWPEYGQGRAGGPPAHPLGAAARPLRRLARGGSGERGARRGGPVMG